jgi:hypothetical protein
MTHTVISEQTEKQMLEQVKKPTRVRKFKEDYARDNVRLEMENHVLKCINERLFKDNAQLQEGYAVMLSAKQDSLNPVAFTSICIAFTLGLLIGVFGKVVVK